MSSGTHDNLYKRALEARVRREAEGRGIAGEDVGELLELMKLGETIAKLDLNKVAAERVARLSEKNRIVHDLVSQSKDVDRRLRQLKAPKKRKKMHWKTKEKKRRDYDKNVRTPRVKARKAQILGERGWFPILLEQWKRTGLQVELTQEEWVTSENARIASTKPPLRASACAFSAPLSALFWTASLTIRLSGFA